MRSVTSDPAMKCWENSSTDNVRNCMSTETSELCETRNEVSSQSDLQCEDMMTLCNEQTRVINLEAMLLQKMVECKCPRRLSYLMELFEKVDNVVTSLKTKIQAHKCRRNRGASV
ncbi:hypothetical protein GCK32_006020 [Trichostrongylus colubriformis]|uniref:Uncharacterized protein n=1 Tax=Trichostrongylus colubriformis TaxID=6319 RepID=A0AAN8INK0_TRICO